jgi:hypothetical protein
MQPEDVEQVVEVVEPPEQSFHADLAGAGPRSLAYFVLVAPAGTGAAGSNAPRALSAQFL